MNERAESGIGDGDSGWVTVRAGVLGQVVELTVEVADDVSDLYWPGATSDNALETQS